MNAIAYNVVRTTPAGSIAAWLCWNGEALVWTHSEPAADLTKAEAEQLADQWSDYWATTGKPARASVEEVEQNPPANPDEV